MPTRDLTKIYGREPNLVKALDGISMEVQEGEFVADKPMGASEPGRQ